MSFRLLLTLLVFGLGGTECHSNSAPAWVKQTDTVVSQVLAAEVSCSENTEHDDLDHDALPTQVKDLSLRRGSAVTATAPQTACYSALTPQARAPPSLV
ncbi:hypothetical protein [Pseudidiomarina aquimaris]|uniref:hypothetical protein n=1 Tax=Pseudidiomarina aquimaris TaxID=641841 RepID=UPI003A976110